MDQLTTAIRLFRRISPEPNQLIEAGTLRKLRVWLSDDVGRVVDELSRRPTFRQYAAWAIQSLQENVDTKERRVIDGLEVALRDVEKAYERLLNNQRIAAQLKLSFPPPLCADTETVEIRNSCVPRITHRQLGTFDELAMEISQLRQLNSQAENRYSLINIDDFFGPQQDFARLNGGDLIQTGSLIVSLNPEFHPVGNFVFQSANRRLNESLYLLTSIRHKVETAINQLQREYAGQKVAQYAWDQLQTQLGLYRVTFQRGRENDLRNDCMVLTQIYAAFHPAPDLVWLGLPAKLIQTGRLILQQRVQGFRGGELFERVHGALIGARRLYEDETVQVSAREEAVARGDLVLVCDPRELFWEGKKVQLATRSHCKSWELLLPLVMKARNGGHDTEDDVFGEKVTGRSGMAMRVQRLKALLPISLRKLIFPGPFPRTY